MLLTMWQGVMTSPLGGALEVDLLKIFSMKLNNEFIHPLVDLTVLFLVKVTGWSDLFGLKINYVIVT